ncbi:MAG: hypothetical protein ACRDRJ_25715 [Streptosporangiaceae bacterium]
MRPLARRRAAHGGPLLRRLAPPAGQDVTSMPPATPVGHPARRRKAAGCLLTRQPPARPDGIPAPARAGL